MPRRPRRDDLDVDRLVALVQDDQACRDLRTYFGAGLAEGELPLYTGGHFELLDDGGDRPEVCDQFTAWDLLAVELLSVQVPRRVALDLVDGALGKDMTALLRQIPTPVRLWTARAEQLIKDGGPADRAWRLLEDQDGVGWVTAGKLLARKRPSLIPVYDNVVRCAFGRPKNPWTALRDALMRPDCRLRTALEDLKADAGIPKAVSPLRVLDVAVWMRHRPVHRGYRCAGLA